MVQAQPCVSVDQAAHVGGEGPAGFSPDGVTERVVDGLVREVVGAGTVTPCVVEGPAVGGLARARVVCGPYVRVTSFGYLHLGGCAPPEADVTVDVRQHLQDPHGDPYLRQLTGHDAAVRERVLAARGAVGLVNGVVAVVVALLPGARAAGRLVRVAVGCAGGRHRSVVLAESIAERLTLDGWGATAEHLHIARAVVNRGGLW